jgi:hypothetical protein
MSARAGYGVILWRPSEYSVRDNAIARPRVRW